MLGLKRGTVRLCDHEKEWETEAQNTILLLKNILGGVIQDIQHIGSTSIVSIKAKPIIDIAIAVDDFNDVLARKTELKNHGFYYVEKSNISDQLLFASGSYYDKTGDLQTHFIHVVHTGSMNWINYVNFRDYLNTTPSAAKEYENLKTTLASQHPIDPGRKYYLSGKQDFIVRTLRKALVHSYLGKKVEVYIDRPIGSVHPKYDNIIYPVNYGYIPNVFSADGEDLDVYLLGVDVRVEKYTARIIGIIHRHNDCEDKLVAAPDSMSFTVAEIEAETRFQERYFDIEIETV